MEPERWEDTRDCALIALGVQTGFRVSELLSLNRGDLMRGGVLRPSIRVAAKNTKTGVSRETILGEATSRLVGTWLDAQRRVLGMIQKEDAAFPSRTRGKRMTRQAAYQMIRARCERCGVSTEHVGTHSMRKTCALLSQCMGDTIQRSGLPIVVVVEVQKVLGHKQIGSTQNYLASVGQMVQTLMFAAADEAVARASSRNG